jgi:hypothetical protein
MYVIPKNDQDCYKIQYELLNNYLPISRFHIRTLELGMHPRANRRGLSLKISTVRLKKKKDYCGQHPNACVVNPFIGPKKHKITSYLEGTDWVAFNDMLNDLCDEHSIEADIWSESIEFVGKMRIRKGQLRLHTYRSAPQSNGFVEFWHWDTNNPSCDYSNRFGQLTRERSDYPNGTPGIPEWLLDREEEFLREHDLEHAH